MSSPHRDPKLRASDADRDAVAESLREHAATGRLTMDEFGERLERCYAAQTYGELDVLVADLPGPDPYSDLPVPPGGVTRTPVPWEPHDLPQQHEPHGGAWAAWASVSLICWAIWLASLISGGSVQGFWPVWVTVPWGGVLLAGMVTGGGPRHALPPGREPMALPSSRHGNRRARRDERYARRRGR